MNNYGIEAKNKSISSRYILKTQLAFLQSQPASVQSQLAFLGSQLAFQESNVANRIS